MNIALLGPTGSGKGSLIQALAEKNQLHPITLGDVLRQKATYGTALGLLTREYVQNGELVPDEFVDAMVEEVFRHLAPEWQRQVPRCEADQTGLGLPRIARSTRS